MAKKANPSPSRKSPKTVAVGVEMVLPPSAVLRASVTGPPLAEAPPRERAPEAVARPAQMVLEVPTLSYPPALPAPTVIPTQTPFGICANCDRAAVIRTNFAWTPDVGFCNLHIPAQYRFLLGA